MKSSVVKLGLAAVLALGSALPATIASAHGNGHSTHPHGKSGESHGKHKGKGKTHKVTYVFKGTWTAGTDPNTGTVHVTRGNHHVRKADLVDTDVQFDLTDARIVVEDTNGDGSDAADLVDGDLVVVKARLDRKDPGDQPFSAKMVVDQTNPPASDDDSTEG